jgi:dTDP-4-dehydrorhamnose 3,5-epimerase
MKFEETGLEGLLLIRLEELKDSRGSFAELYREDIFNLKGILPEEKSIVQVNSSKSKAGSVRGLHYQSPPYAQDKLVRVPRGRILDVAVDIRRNSKTFGKYYAIELSDNQPLALWIPEGFAHGFASMEEGSIVDYLLTNKYAASAQGGIQWNDPDLNIPWQVRDPVVSEKDSALPLWRDMRSPFE